MDDCVCASEAGSILPATAADEEQTFQPGRTRHDFHFHRDLEYGLDKHTHVIRPHLWYSNTNVLPGVCFDDNELLWSLSVGSVPSPKSVASWVLCRGLGKTLDEMTVTIPHDLYAFGTQENSVGDREWVESIRAVLKEHTELDYKPVRICFSELTLNAGS